MVISLCIAWLLHYVLHKSCIVVALLLHIVALCWVCFGYISIGLYVLICAYIKGVLLLGCCYDVYMMRKHMFMRVYVCLCVWFWWIVVDCVRV